MIKIVDGDLIQANVPLIAHQTNCLGVMGAGIAKAIKNKWPNVYTQYKDFCKDFNYSRVLLGDAQICKTNDTPIKYVANLYGEYSYAESVAPNGNRHTDYNALELALSTLQEICHISDIKEIGIPYKLGCGLAGGDWYNVVYPMLRKLFEDDPKITLYIYKLYKN